MKNAGFNRIDLSKYIKFPKDKTRRNSAFSPTSRFSYKLPEEIRCLHDEEHMINKEITAVHTLDELRETINLFRYDRRYYDIPDAIVNFIKRNGQTNLADNFASHFAVDKVSLRSNALGRVRSISNLLLWLKYDIRSRIYGNWYRYKLNNEQTRKASGKTVNVKAIVLQTILETLLFDKKLRNIITKGKVMPFSVATVDVKLRTDDAIGKNQEETEILDKFFVSVNNIEGQLDIYVNALRIARALYREYEDPNVAYTAGMEVCKANLAKNTSLYDNILNTYIVEQSAEAEEVADTTSSVVDASTLEVKENITMEVDSVSIIDPETLTEVKTEIVLEKENPALNV